MKKYLIEKPKQKKINNQNKLRKVLYPSNSKPITYEMNTGKNKQKSNKKRINTNDKKIRNETTSPSSRNAQKNKNKNAKNTKAINKSLNNNTFLELDYLNFSKIDLGLRKLNSSFDDDIFGSNIFKDEKNKIVSNRYDGIDSSIDTIKIETQNNNYIEESKENLLKTPSTLCNYYDISEAASGTKKKNNEKEIENSNNKNELRKNLDKLYENSKNDDIKYISVNTKAPNVVNWKVKDSIKITKNKSSTLNLKENEKKEKENNKNINNNNTNNNNNNTNNSNQKEINNKNKNNSKNKQIQKHSNLNNEIHYKNNLMENYLNSKIQKRKGSCNM